MWVIVPNKSIKELLYVFGMYLNILGILEPIQIDNLNFLLGSETMFGSFHTADAFGVSNQAVTLQPV